jgi:hypothetical protein
MDAKTLGALPASPCQPRSPQGEFASELQPGLTKREAFAMAALQGLCASAGVQVQIHAEGGVLTLPARVGIPMLAVEYADNLLASLAMEDGP